MNAYADTLVKLEAEAKTHEATAAKIRMAMRALADLCINTGAVKRTRTKETQPRRQMDGASEIASVLNAMGDGADHNAKSVAERTGRTTHRASIALSYLARTRRIQRVGVGIYRANVQPAAVVSEPVVSEPQHELAAMTA